MISPEQYVRAALDTCKGKIRTFNELPAYCGFYFNDDFDYNPQSVTKHFIPENKPRLKAVREAVRRRGEIRRGEFGSGAKGRCDTAWCKGGCAGSPGASCGHWQ